MGTTRCSAAILTTPNRGSVATIHWPAGQAPTVLMAGQVAIRPTMRPRQVPVAINLLAGSVSGRRRQGRHAHQHRERYRLDLRRHPHLVTQEQIHWPAEPALTASTVATAKIRPIIRPQHEAVTVNLADGHVSRGDAAGDTLTSIENVFGSESGDNLTGDAGANRLGGHGGDDTLTGNDGMTRCWGREAMTASMVVRGPMHSLAGLALTWLTIPIDRWSVGQFGHRRGFWRRCGWRHL